VGAFFYVAPEHEAAARETLRGGGYRPYEPSAWPRIRCGRWREVSCRGGRCLCSGSTLPL